MNIALTPMELLHIYKTLLSNPLDDKVQNDCLLDKLQRPIVSSLEKEYDRINENKFKSWKGNEQKKIDELNNSLNDVRISYEKSVKRTRHDIR